MLDEAKSERLRRLVDEVLMTERDAAYSVTNVFAHVGGRAEREGINLRAAGGGWNKVAGAVILEYWWRLVRLGVVSIPGAPIGGASGPHEAIPAWHLSTYGRELLQKGSASPHDAHRYFADLRSRLRRVDEIALLYLSDAVRAWEANLYRASAVMLGCACERLIMELAKLAADKIAERAAEKLRRRLGSRFAPHVADVFEDLRELLDVAGLPPKLADGLDRKLVSIFEHARGLRNKSGHPTGDEVTQEEAHAGLLLFPGFCVFVDEIRTHLEGESV